jgi:hypothetical protein
MDAAQRKPLKARSATQIQTDALPGFASFRLLGVVVLEKVAFCRAFL